MYLLDNKFQKEDTSTAADKNDRHDHGDHQKGGHFGRPETLD